ncbi:phosphate ABC transporter ATP-binding protein [Vibrio mediterranei]|uniref:phosphate ABC transporter ATP-binding protein n=1 Tax=Vibrio mediterranei TaxID=689 RepID=UPI00148E59BE|nr:phosphate ABC transporter ATP-binding protein [Vibrio mediterranei]NOI24521.1 phosphate ABC transporter ATP-binding protein [Vibrio mediterranei]
MSFQPSSQLAGSVSNLTIAFGSNQVVRNANMDFYRHQIHVLTGASGSGKTTFLRALNRLNDCFAECKTTGDIKLTLNDTQHCVQKMPEHQLPQLRQKVGMVFQHPQLLPGSIIDNLLLPLRVVNSVTGQEAHQIAQTALDQAALWEEVSDRLSDHAASLSGGQQQRLCLARTLALEPEILLLDEPTASLDKHTAQQIESLIVELAKRYTIIMVSHSAKQTEKLANRVSHFESGKVFTR